MLESEKLNGNHVADEAEEATLWAADAARDDDSASQLKIAMSGPLDGWLDRFDELWRNQKPPRVDAFFAQALASGEVQTDQNRLMLLHELIARDLENRWKDFGVTLVGSATVRESHEASVAPSLTDYAQVLQPQFGPPGEWPVELLLGEYRIRHSFGDQCSAEQFAREHPGRADLLQRLREVDLELAK